MKKALIIGKSPQEQYLGIEFIQNLIYSGNFITFAINNVYEKYQQIDFLVHFDWLDVLLPDNFKNGITGRQNRNNMGFCENKYTFLEVVEGAIIEPVEYFNYKKIGLQDFSASMAVNLAYILGCSECYFIGISHCDDKKYPEICNNRFKSYVESYHHSKKMRIIQTDSESLNGWDIDFEEI